MPRGYWIARVQVKDPEAYKEYVALTAKAFAKYGARAIVRGGAHHTLEGEDRPRNVVWEFDDVETALACYHSEEYAPALAIRQRAARSEVVIVEGYEGPQPGEG